MLFDTLLVEYAWKVPTTGASDHSVAAQLATGALGSCTWTTSKWPPRTARLSVAVLSGNTDRLDTAPFMGNPTVRPSGIR